MSRRTSNRLASSGAPADGNGIERSSDYEEFMDRLQAYHDQRGTTLTTVPEIAGVKINLFELYQTVTSEGGYDRITGTKGAWKDLSERFALTPNTTNGFLLKSAYYKNLAAYEITTFFKRQPPPKELLEDRTAAGGPIQTRVLEQSDDSSSEDEEKSRTPPPSTGGRTLRQAPPKREFYQPGLTPSRPSSTRSGSNMSGPMHPQQGYSGSPPRGMPAPPGPPSFMQNNNSQLPFARTVPTPANDPERFAQRRMHHGLPRRTDVPFGPIHLARAYLGLKSGLESEADYALYAAVRSSFEVPTALTDPNFPELAELVVNYLSAEKISPQYRTVPENGEIEDGLIPKELHTQLNRIADAALAVRNSTNESGGAHEISELPEFTTGIMSIMSLPKRPCFAEVRNYCLDIIENTAAFWHLKAEDPFLEELKQGVRSEDRAVVVRSLRILSNFGSMYNVEYLKPQDCWIVETVLPLLMLDDVDMLIVIIQFVNRFTTVEENCEELIKQSYSNSLIKQMIRLLEYNSMISEEIRPLFQESRKEMPPIPTLPQEIVQDLLTFAEPERAAMWMRCCFEEDSGADITQIQLWQAYQARFSEFVAHGRPLLPAADFIKHVSIAFKNAGAKVVEIGPGQTRFIIRGIRPREAPMSPRGTVYLPCKWLYHHGQCSKQAPSARDLYTHIISAHLPRHDTPDGQPATPPVLHCCWNGCNRFGPTGSTDRKAVIAHIRTHMPDTNAKKPSNGKLNPQQLLKYDVQVPMLDPQGKPGILPLTLVLALRNFGKLADGRELLYPHRDIICQMAAWIGGSQYGHSLSRYLMELFVDSDLDPRDKEEEEVAQE